jgi:hypothetical protein
MTLKTITVDNCFDCPYSQITRAAMGRNANVVCNNVHRMETPVVLCRLDDIINGGIPIPKWCRLDDADEGNQKVQVAPGVWARDEDSTERSIYLGERQVAFYDLDENGQRVPVAWIRSEPDAPMGSGE